MRDDPELRRHLFDLEEQLVGPATRSSRAKLEELLAEDFVEVGSSGGIRDRASIISEAMQETPAAWSIADFRMTILADDVVLVTYIGTRAGGVSSIRSSIWKRSGGRWQMAFHQGTRIQE